jgi:peptidoglycan/xylan/chitin deacetylase (PgdA/CDA1 family)
MIVKNFLFHRVSDETDRLWPPMRVSLFKSLIAYITQHYQVINLEEFVTGGNREKLSRPATILFDDGYKDNIEYAAPILEQYRCPASFYVVTGCIDANRPTWTYIVDFLLQQSRVPVLTLDLDFAPREFQQHTFRDAADRLELGSRLKPWMKSLSNDERTRVLNSLQRVFNDVEVPGDKMMNWNELRQMQTAGFIIGSHSVTHPLLASIRNEDELFFELTESGRRIKEELGQFPITISYPIGSYDDRVIAASQKAGYRMGLAVRQRFYDLNKDGIFSIPRVELYEEPMWKCRLRISGAYNWLKRIMR